MKQRFQKAPTLNIHNVRNVRYVHNVRPMWKTRNVRSTSYTIDGPLLFCCCWTKEWRKCCSTHCC